jgi:hypothetical protein
VHALHVAVLDRYEILEEEALPPRQALLLDYLLKQERILNETVQRSLKQEGEGVLKAFVDTKMSLDSDKVLEEARLPEHPSTDDLSRAAFLTRDAIIAALKESARCASERKVKELFLSLWKLEESERNHIAMALMQLDDL